MESGPRWYELVGYFVLVTAIFAVVHYGIPALLGL